MMNDRLRISKCPPPNMHQQRHDVNPNLQDKCQHPVAELSVTVTPTQDISITAT